MQLPRSAATTSQSTTFSVEFAQATQNQAVPTMMRSIYAQQILDQMIFQQALDYEATRLGLQVTPEEQTERLKEILPDGLGRRRLAKGSLR